MASLRSLIEGFITSAATDVVNLTRWTTGAKDGSNLNALNTTDKTSLPAAINAVLVIAQNAQNAAGAAIDDASTSTSKTWSSSKTNSSIQAAVAAVVNSSPATLDTLAEFATALNNDPNFATTMMTMLGNRVRVDDVQAFSAAQKAQGLSNLGAVAAADIGDTTSSLVAVYNAAKSA
ncbi:hypothetical protein AS850_02615 [Frondihabitans sp. 762G35]|uniref:hypothetical protein n=1 Tax=Frondihabitans sp. 762G35 TaxID=1446794 RepID=UPI000D21E20F|nr:hypothetical protein [Frondihabitans sp. 762G35]ARC55965.1 hypothetical protein AS850_02615 [Frondihabitans sp. 762G35]